MANPIGSVDKLTGVVKVRHADGSTDVLRQGAPVFQGDTLETGGDGSVGVVFVDKSTFSLGPKGRMVMDEMVFDPAHPGEGHATLVALNGAFTFVSGQVAKAAPEAMQIKTPVMTIGVRGTSVAGVAASEGSPNVVTLLRDGDGSLGQLTISNAAGRQVLNAEAQTIQSSSFIRTFEPPRQLTAAEVLALFSAALAAQPLPPAQPPAVPQANPEPPPPASQGGSSQPAPEPPQNGGETPPTPTPPPLPAGLPVDPAQVITMLGPVNAWLINWIVTELGKGDQGGQGAADVGVVEPMRDPSKDIAGTGAGQAVTPRVNTIIGTAGGETLTGTDGIDDIYGLGGDDTIYGLGGNDSITPGTGYDHVFAGDGNDVIEMTLDGSYDTVVGGGGRDTLSYAAETVGLTVSLAAGTVYDGIYSDTFTGIEVFIGGLGNDQVTGSTGSDTIYGGIGNDSLIGNLGDDALYGEVGNDTLEGGDGNDTLDGGTGADSLYGGDGADTVRGGTGDDIIFLTKDNYDDTVDGGTGVDTLNLWTETSRLEISLSSGTFTYVGGDTMSHTDTITDVENVYCGSGNDWVVGNDANNSLFGGMGDDTLEGGAGNDTLDGGVGADTLIGGSGADTLTGGAGADTLVGGDGADLIALGTDNLSDVVKISGTSVMSAGLDTITGFEVGTDQIQILADVFTNLSNVNVNYGTDLASALSAGITQIIGVDDSGAVDLYYVTAAGQSYQIASIADTTASALSSAGSVVVT